MSRLKRGLQITQPLLLFKNRSDKSTRSSSLNVSTTDGALQQQYDVFALDAAALEVLAPVDQTAHGQAFLLTREREGEAELQQTPRQAVLGDELGQALGQVVEQLTRHARTVRDIGL